MKKMIRMTAMVAAMFVAVSTVAKAQDPAQQGRGRGGASARIMAVLDSVKASADVKAKADSIIKATAALNAPLMAIELYGDVDLVHRCGIRANAFLQARIELEKSVVGRSVLQP